MTTDGYWIERHPPHCPQGHPWNKTGTYLPGWDSLNDTGHRIWTCQTCNTTIHANPGESLLEYHNHP